MKEYPILFKAEMIRAILAGRKTQTRRVIKSIIPEWELNPIMEDIYTGVFEWDKHPWPWRMTNPKQKYDGRFGVFVQFQTDVDDYATTFLPCPYGNPGDRLWACETWAASKLFDNLKPSEIYPDDTSLWYKAGGDHALPGDEKGKLRPSIFMPRWASRITLKNERSWVERMQDISEEGIRAEGLFNQSGLHLWDCPYQVFHPDQVCGCGDLTLQENFSNLWDSINAKRGYGWNRNPWVWATEFSVIEI